jgi:hypothetical protein
LAGAFRCYPAAHQQYIIGHLLHRQGSVGNKPVVALVPLLREAIEKQRCKRKKMSWVDKMDYANNNLSADRQVQNM